jgi:hypothetical protein
LNYYKESRDVAAAEVVKNRGLENVARQSDLVGFQQKAIAEVAVGTTVIKRTGAVTR